MYDTGLPTSNSALEWRPHQKYKNHFSAYYVLRFQDKPAKLEMSIWKANLLLLWFRQNVEYILKEYMKLNELF